MKKLGLILILIFTIHLTKAQQIGLPISELIWELIEQAQETYEKNPNDDNKAILNRHFFQTQFLNKSLAFQSLEGKFLEEINFSNLNLHQFNFAKAKLKGAFLNDTSLFEGFFIGADLTNADFRGANLTNASLEDAILIEADFRGATLIKTNFSGANLTGAKLDGLDLSKTYYNEHTKGLTEQQKQVMIYLKPHSNIPENTEEFLNTVKNNQPRALTYEQNYAVKTTVFNKDVKIAHLPQISINDHLFDFPTQSVRDPHSLVQSPFAISPIITMSQFKIFHTLIDYNMRGEEFVVFDDSRIGVDCTGQTRAPEDIEEDTNQENMIGLRYISPCDMAEGQRAKSLFYQNGYLTLPNYYEALTANQKELFYTQGASHLLYYLGVIDKIYHTLSAEEFVTYKNNEITHAQDYPYDEHNFYWNFVFKQVSLNNKINFFLDEYKKRNGKEYGGKIFVIMGALHDLSDAFKFKPPYYERGEHLVSHTNLHWFIK